MRNYSRWQFEPEDFVVVGYKEVTPEQKKRAAEIMDRITNQLECDE
jgi:hypothetical protein